MRSLRNIHRMRIIQTTATPTTHRIASNYNHHCLQSLYIHNNQSQQQTRPQSNSLPSVAIPSDIGTFNNLQQQSSDSLMANSMDSLFPNTTFSANRNNENEQNERPPPIQTNHSNYPFATFFDSDNQWIATSYPPTFTTNKYEQYQWTE